MRHLLHKFPDLSGDEQETADRIKDFISTYTNPSGIIEFTGAGFGVVFDSKQAGPTILFRCELDALPIQEKNNFEHQSTRPGISHKCGHDGHITILCGLAVSLTAQPLTHGKMVLLFQPSEENGLGAQSIVTDESFKSLHPDYIFALHNIPGRPLHQVIIKKSICTPSVISVSIDLRGKVAHASSPEMGINPALALSAIINRFEEWNHPDTGSPDFALLTPIYAHLGQKAYGIAAGEGTLHYTIRTRTVEKMEHLKNQIIEYVHKTGISNQLHYQINWFDEFPTVTNNSKCNEQIIRAAEKLKLDCLSEDAPFKFGEDFGWFSRDYKTALFGIGAGIDSPSLHNEYYDFPDDLIATGTNLFYEIASMTLQ